MRPIWIVILEEILSYKYQFNEFPTKNHLTTIFPFSENHPDMLKKMFKLRIIQIIKRKGRNAIEITPLGYRLLLAHYIMERDLTGMTKLREHLKSYPKIWKKLQEYFRDAFSSTVSKSKLIFDLIYKNKI